MHAEPVESTLLAELADLRLARRASSDSWWYPMVIFGLVAIAGGLVSLANDAVQVAWWAGAIAAAMALTARFYRRRSSALGVVPKHRRYWLLWVLITVGAFGGPIVAPAPAKAAAAWIVVALGYAVAAGMGRSARLAVLAGTLGLVSAVVVAVSAPAMTANLACGVVLIGSGLAAHAAESAR